MMIRLAQCLLFLCALLLPALVAAQPRHFYETSASMQLNENGEPLRPNERRVRREDFNEKYWGIRLDQIDDEFVMKKGDETLFITAGGEIIIKKAAPGYPGETGKSYDSTEEMLAQEGRWDELREYNQKVAARQQPGIGRSPSSHSPRLVLSARPGQAAIGERMSVHVVLGNVAPDKPCRIGLSLGFDPSVVKLERVQLSHGVQLVGQVVRRTLGDRHVARLCVECEPSRARPSSSTAILIFRAVGRGECTVEPLSVEADARPGKTFLRVGQSLVRPEVSQVTVRVR